MHTVSDLTMTLHESQTLLTFKEINLLTTISNQNQNTQVFFVCDIVDGHTLATDWDTEMCCDVNKLLSHTHTDTQHQTCT